ncbi:MAG: hypothetical protein GC166_06340 [Alphaproteobacteria bacterium]|nr:hypothetical protein [Alphaproteobacteria bacterium]
MKAKRTRRKYSRDPRDQALTEDQRLALMALANYYLAKNQDGALHESGSRRPLTQTDLFAKLYPGDWQKRLSEQSDAAEAEADAKHAFYSFLRAGSEMGCHYFYEHLKPIMATEKYWNTQYARPFIQEAIAVAFGFRPKTYAPKRTPEAVFKELTKGEREFLPNMARDFAGLWDVIRYSAHGDQIAHKSRNPRVMRAGLKISVPDIEGEMLPFEIHYRPGGYGEPIRKSYGSIVSLGRGTQMEFVGWEDQPLRFPLTIWAPQSEKERPELFVGLVVRFHEKRKSFFASRVLFVRSQAETLEALENKIGMTRYKELREQFRIERPSMTDEDYKGLMSEIVNVIGSAGRSGLHQN